MGKTPLGIYIKGLLKRLVWWNITKVKKSDNQKDIVICTSRRSGGTWLMELIAKEKGIRSVGQPFSVYQFGENELKQIPIFESGQFIFLDEEEQGHVKDYLLKVLSGEFHINEPWNFWNSSFDFTANRHILKITDALPIIDWIAGEFDVDVVYSTRHPIPQALSCLKLNWSPTCKSYLRNEPFVKKYLDNELYEYSWKMMIKGLPIEKFVLNWVLENLVPLKHSAKVGDYITLNYEENVLYPEETIKHLAEKLRLSDANKMISKVNKPSRTTTDEISRNFGKSRSNNFNEAMFRLSNWKKEVDRDMELKVFKILSRFSIDIYQPDRLIPTRPYLNFQK